MYYKKVAHFQKAFPEENCLSGIVTATIDKFNVGTPCIASVKPFSKSVGSSGSMTRPSFMEFTLDLSENRSKSVPNKIEPTNRDVTRAIDLYDMDVKKANDVIASSVHKVDLLFLHHIRSGPNDFYKHSTYAKGFHFTGDKPILYDDCLRAESNSLQDMISEEEMKDLAGFTSEGLKKYRYLNYTVNNVARSNISSVQKDISGAVKFLTKGFPNTICFYQGDTKCRSLIDDVSISFYRLSDSIAIFDSSRAVGTCMEIFLGSSTNGDNIYPGKSMSWQFLFSKYKDNAFSIDGEQIGWPSGISVSDGLHHVGLGLVKNVGNDEVFKKKKKL